VPGGLGTSTHCAEGKRPAPRKHGGGATVAVSGDALTAPMQGTIVKVAVEEGQQVAEGDLVVVLEAMKMEQPITAHRSGTIANLSAEVGAPVQSGAPLCTIAD
jgi:acetyl-CoA/propionyl-CoA carboxylase biotin carboxyl carrier protein